MPQTLFDRSRRKQFTSLVFFVVALLLAYAVSTFIIKEDLTGLAFVGLIFAGLTIVVAILQNWRTGFYLFLAWLLFEDFARKFLGNNMAIYFAKDFLAIVVYLSFFLAYRRKEVPGFRPPFLIGLLLFIWFAVIQIFNPASTSIFYGLLGFKLYFYYIPLLFVGYGLVNSEKDLRRFFTISLGLAFIIGALGIAQAIVGHTFLNPENPAEEIQALSQLYRTAPISGAHLYRPTSVFVSDGRFASYLILAWLLAFGNASYLLLRRRRGRLMTALVFIVLSAGIVLSGSRGAFVWIIGSALVGMFAILWGASWRPGQKARAIRAIHRSALGIGVALAGLLLAFPEALMSRFSFYNETLSLDSSRSELVARATQYPLQNFLGAFAYPRWPYGYGTGTAALGVQYITRILKVAPMYVGVENGYGTLVVEMGILGLILWIVMSVAVIVSAWRIVRKLKGSICFPIGFIIFWYALLLLFPMMYGSAVTYQNFVLNAHLWVLLGILFRLPTVTLDSSVEAPHARFRAA